MITDYNLSDHVSLQTNVSFSNLIHLMQLSKVYFHPRTDEHFGISIVEAMAQGLCQVYLPTYNTLKHLEYKVIEER
jgi:hypothetical protein